MRLPHKSSNRYSVAGQIEHHVVASPAPNQRDNNDPARCPCILKPVNGCQADGTNHMVDKTICCKQRLEDHGVGTSEVAHGRKIMVR